MLMTSLVLTNANHWLFDSEVFDVVLDVYKVDVDDIGLYVPMRQPFIPRCNNVKNVLVSLPRSIRQKP
jgi:hypothetical protein